MLCLTLLTLSMTVTVVANSCCRFAFLLWIDDGTELPLDDYHNLNVTGESPTSETSGHAQHREFAIEDVR